MSFDGLASALSADAVVSHIRGTEISSLHGRNHLLYCYIETSQGKLLRNLQVSEMLNALFSRDSSTDWFSHHIVTIKAVSE